MIMLMAITEIATYCNPLAKLKAGYTIHSAPKKPKLMDPFRTLGFIFLFVITFPYFSIDFTWLGWRDSTYLRQSRPATPRFHDIKQA